MSVIDKFLLWIIRTIKGERSTASVLKDRITGLVFVSETDSYWNVLDRSDVRYEELDCEMMGRLAACKGECIEIDFETFMDHSIATQTPKQRYLDLKESLTELFGPPRAFKITTTPNKYIYYIWRC